MSRISKKQFDLVISKIAGEDVVPLANFLKTRKDISEFEIAEKIGAEINSTRNMLYRLDQANLVTSNRKKDEKKGWYIYYWSFRTEMVADLARQIRENKIKKLKEKLDKEVKRVMFLCENECVALDFDQALDFKFMCPECGLIMNHKENGKEYVEAIRCKIKDLEKGMI